MSNGKRVCVVGAGISGLVSLKSCLEAGLDVTCYEKTDDIGGLWRYRETNIAGTGSVMYSTASITSKEMSAMSDFPPMAHVANYMHHTHIVEYLEQYAENFRLRDNIFFNHEVLKLLPDASFDDTGQWRVKLKNKEGKNFEELFDAVVVCTGSFIYPHEPAFPGLDSFRGKVVHTHKYKNFHGMENSRTVVVGVGSSGTNVAVELARVGKHIPVHLSTRTGAWIIPRVAENGLPFDILYARRYLHFLFARVLPTAMTNSFFEKKLNRRMDHGLYRIKPAFRFIEQNATVEDDLAVRVLTGTVAIRGDIHRFTTHGVIFKGEEDREYPVDAVVLATGYIVKIPCVGDDIIKLQEDRVELYNFVFPPVIKHNTLAVVGLVQPNGAIIPTAEMQSRWVAKVFTGECTLPNKEIMMQAIDNHHQSGRKNPLETDWFAYLDTMAKYIGAQPNLRKLAFTDPKLFFACVFGPCVPYQYRLHGPNQWSHARKAILTVFDRVQCPLNTRCSIVACRHPFPLYVTSVCVAVILFLYVILF